MTYEVDYNKVNNNNNNNKSFIFHTLEYKISSAQHNGAQLCIILVLKNRMVKSWFLTK